LFFGDLGVAPGRAASFEVTESFLVVAVEGGAADAGVLGNGRDAHSGACVVQVGQSLFYLLVAVGGGIRCAPG
jgi:hypothetical protein